MKIRNYPVFFQLEYTEDETDKVYTLKDEPIGWDKVELILERDKTYWGVNYSYSDGEIDLEFSPGYGSEIIKALFDSYGTDYTIVFRYGYTKNSAKYTLFEGRLNLNTYKYDYKKNVSCTIETPGFHANISSRIDTDVDLFDKTTLDLNAAQSISPVDVTLHSKGIKYRYKCDNEESTLLGGASIEETLDSYTNTFYFTFNTQDYTTSEIETLDGTVNMSFEDAPYSGDTLLPVWSEAVPGRYTFKFDVAFNPIGQISPSTYADTIGESVYTDSSNIKVYLRVVHEDSTFEEYELYSFYERGNYGYDVASTGYTKNKDSNSGLTIWFHHFEKEIDNITILENDSIYIYGVNTFTTKGYRKAECTRGINTLIFNLSVTAITHLDDSSSKAFLIHEALTKVINSMTGIENAFYSEYFGRTDLGYGTNGTGSKYGLLNGFLIRNFIDEDTDEALRELTTTFKDLIVSLRAIFCVGVGYEYINNILKVRIEDFDYFFQDVEILTISENSEYTEEVDEDDIFNTVTVGYEKYPEEGDYMLDEFNTEQEYSTPIKTVDKELELKSKLIASGYAIEETRRSQYDDDQPDSTTYDDDVFIVALRQDDSGNWKSEKNEDFTVTDGTIFDPDTAYNLRITPKRNLFRWAHYLNGFLTWFKNTDGIKNTSYVDNGDAETVLSGESITVKEDADIVLSDLDSRIHKTKVIWINFKCRVSQDDIITIRNAFNGTDDTIKNGYISTYDMNGKAVKGYIYQMNYNPAKEEATFKLLKADIQTGGVAVSCSDYADYTFADFENKALPSTIEDCLFEDFN
jgi:hypothetical protein